MLRSYRIGKFFGIDVYFHWTFLLLPLWAFLSQMGTGEVKMAFFLAAFVVTIFGCVLLHEFGHALMARRFGISTRDITLYPIGGIARLSRMSDRPWEEFWIALAGPAVNVGIAGALLCFTMVATLSVRGGDFGDFFGGNFVVLLMMANVYLVLFNMLPAFPMDGGRVVRALLASRLGLLRATEWAAALGRFMSGLFVLVGILAFLQVLPNVSPMLILIGLFVLFAGQQELAGVRHREAARLAGPLDMLPGGDADGVLTVVPADPGFSGFTWDSHARLWVEWHNGRPIQTVCIESE